MLLRCSTLDNAITDGGKYNVKGQSRHDNIYEPLKGTWGITEVKRHGFEPETTLPTDEGFVWGVEVPYSKNFSTKKY